MINLYIDFDGVILNTIDVTYHMLDELNIAHDNAPKVSEFYANLDWNELLNNCEQINESIECIKKIIESNLYNVYILSHVNSLHEAEEKIKYIRKYLKGVTFIPVPRNVKKSRMVYSKNTILIDDYAGNLRDWEENGGIGVRFSLKLNGKGFCAIDRLDKILDLNMGVYIKNEQ